MIFVNFYAYSIMVKFEMKLLDLIKNSFLFALGRLPWNIITFALIAVLCYFTFVNYVIGMLVLILILYALCGFLVVFSVYPTIEKYMIIPAKKIENEAETNTIEE